MKPKRPKARTHDDYRTFVHLWAAGAPIPAISAKLGVSARVLFILVSVLRKAGVHLPVRRAVPRVTLTPAFIAELNAIATGEPLRKDQGI
jgi:hypothetical protein